ncbi:MAG: alpha/beta hydrolase [Hyphomonas sp.]|nr:alpha/beta hydrolase [Hyphomonas sp.]
MIRFRIGILAIAVAGFAACASPPKAPPPAAPAPELVPEAVPEPEPPRDLLVELSAAEVLGDTDEMASLARELAADPETDEALMMDLAEMMASIGETDFALSAYQDAAEAEAAQDEPDFSRLIDLEARMAEIAAEADMADEAVLHAGRAVGLVNDHLGADHPRMAPLLAFVKAYELDLDAVAAAGGLYEAEEAEAVLAESVDRARMDETVLPSSRGTPAPRIGGEEPPFDIVKVFYGTDRKPAPVKNIKVGERAVLDPRTYYSAERGDLETGSVLVSVPRNRNVGEIPKPSVLRFDFRPDPAKHVILGDMKVHANMTAFVNDVRRELAVSERREIFVLVHGYNTSFDAGIERTAQLAVDLEIDGAPVFYSWPSAGSLFSYGADRAQITDEAVADLEAFLTVLSEKTGAGHISVVAHSMGNEFLVRALDKLAKREEPKQMFDEVIFASPDVEAGEFREMVSGFGPLAGDLTLYASSKDRALQVSRRFNGTGKRAGESVDPVLLPKLDTIDTSNVTDGGLGHSDIFGGAFTDFQAILWLSLEPDKRCVLGRREDGGAVTWVLGNPRTEFCGSEAFQTAIVTMRRVGMERSAEVMSEEALKAGALGDLPKASVWESALKIFQWLPLAGAVLPEDSPKP